MDWGNLTTLVGGSDSFLSNHWSSTNIVCICYTAIFIVIWKILYCWVHQFSLANNHATIPELLLSQIDIDFTDLFSFKRWNNLPSFIFRVITASAGNDWFTEFLPVPVCCVYCLCCISVSLCMCLPSSRKEQLFTKQSINHIKLIILN